MVTNAESNRGCAGFYKMARGLVAPSLILSLSLARGV